MRLRYLHHCETVYCIEGKATVEEVASGRVLRIEPGTLYSAGIGDEHILRIEEDVKFLCIFDPALQGQEQAD